MESQLIADAVLVITVGVVAKYLEILFDQLKVEKENKRIQRGFL